MIDLRMMVLYGCFPLPDLPEGENLDASILIFDGFTLMMILQRRLAELLGKKLTQTTNFVRVSNCLYPASQSHADVKDKIRGLSETTSFFWGVLKDIRNPYLHPNFVA